MHHNAGEYVLGLYFSGEILKILKLGSNKSASKYWNTIRFTWETLLKKNLVGLCFIIFANFAIFFQIHEILSRKLVHAKISTFKVVIQSPWLGLESPFLKIIRGLPIFEKIVH